MPSSTSSSKIRPPSAEERLAETVSGLVRTWMRWGREEGRTLGLSFPQLTLLHKLQMVDSLPITRWAEMIGCSPSAITGLIDGLEAEGYLRREHGEADRRQVLISLTPKGREVSERLQASFRERWIEICKGVPRDRIESATRTLETILTRTGSDESLEMPTRPLSKAATEP
jgi:DNA-binding MarR family transcriptional regulator